MNLSFVLVAVVYFAAVALWRKFRSGEIPWRIAVFFYALVLIFLFQPLTQRYVNVPADFLSTLQPWREVIEPHYVANPEINDVILQMVPWAHQVRESWRSGVAPLWNANAGGGYPLLANGQSAPLSPLRLIALPLPLGQSFAAEAALKLLIALTATFLFLRRRYSFVASTAGAVAFGFSTYLIVWLHFPHASVTAFLPAAFLGMELLFERITYRRFVLASLVFGAIFLGGHPESAAHIGFACALFLIYLTITTVQSRWQKVAVVCASGLAGGLLAAPFLLTFFEALPRSQRYDWLQHDEGASYVPTLPTFLLLFQPRFFGLIREWNNVGPGFAEMVCGSAGILGLVGWITATLATVRRRSAPRFFVYATPLIAGIALAWPLLLDAFETLPLFSMAANARFRLVLCFFFAVFVAFAIDAARRERIGIAVGITLTVALFLVSWFRDLPTAAAREEALLTSVPALLVLSMVIALALRGRMRSLRVPLLAAIVLEVWTFGINWNPVVPQRQLYPSTPLINRLLVERDRHHAADVPFRVAGLTSMLFPNAAAMYGLEDIRSHDPMSYGRVLGLLRVFTGYSSDEYFGMLTKIDSSFIDFMNVKYVVIGPRDGLRDPRFVPLYVGRDGKLFLNRAALPRFFAARRVVNEFDDMKRVELMITPHDWRDVIVKRLPTQLGDAVLARLLRSNGSAAVRARQLRDDRFTIDVDARDWTLVASSQPEWPGWKAYRQGKRVKLLTVNESFIGFVVPPGRSTIELVYAPLSWRVGATIAITTLAGLLLGFFVFRRRATRVK